MQFWIINQMVFFIINPKILAGIWIPSIVSVILCPHCYEIFSRSDPLRSFPSIWLNNFLLEVLLIVKQSYDWQVKQETDTFLITIYKCASAIVMKLSYQEQQVPWLYIPQCLNHGYILLSLNSFEIILAFYYLNILIGK